MSDVLITEYTDPGCPWAYSAEPFRRRLAWLYGDRLERRTCMVGPAAEPADYESPGLQPFAAYDVVLANLVPDAERRQAPSDVTEVLAWAGEPPASQEVAVACEPTRFEAREALGHVAREQHVGADGLWSL